jgi:hypothetical protein
MRDTGILVNESSESLEARAVARIPRVLNHQAAQQSHELIFFDEGTDFID